MTRTARKAGTDPGRQADFGVIDAGAWKWRNQGRPVTLLPACAAWPAAGNRFCHEERQVAYLRSKGCPAPEKRRGSDESWQVWIKGPDNIDIEFHQYTPESHQITGELCHAKW